MNVIIIGYGMAGARLAAELHARDGDRKVTVLGAEPHRAYNRIMLSTLLAGKIGEPDVELAEVAGQGVDVRTGVAVTAIDRAAREVRTADGDRIGYDHLVLATGSRALVPPLPGLDPLPERVVPFRTLDDCRRILAAARGARSALVLGGGLLGLEAARGLAARGLDVTVVHPMGHLMERQLDPPAGAVLAGTLAGLGVRTELAVSATAVATDGDRVRLDLADGRALTADLLVLSCGVRPDTALAADAGLAVERGVVVDDRMRTSDRRISAIGDCAQHAGVLTGLVAPAWAQARVVAEVLAGSDRLTRYRPRPMVTRLKAAGIDLAAMGDAMDDAPADEELTFADPARGTYARLRIRDERLTGAILLGDNPAVGTVVQLFDRGAPVPADRRSLLLGRAFGAAPAAPAASPALMPDAATVCQCNDVSKGALVACWRAGARTVAELSTATRAATGCGGCRDAVAGIADWLAAADPVGATR
ncbi:MULTISPECIES: FAD-dependent oxidoreductase [Micromonospora]|uniref:NAD(P)/FAD-dependent oxidoreductase n=1 Tax=Micromonospora solifontis TaxID=2487138 RepID=A0ABX9WBX0_9ACTN|nr:MULTISPECIES: FAD-dependent oxidoreductase [Micromonospora]NES12653.1 NAD(P)/FAD-dependent oxidoreductase [Micromonospora sp. PPF5-17B]NES38789.1 NAD(P)/FAD-dependent oxidoreductase [Micromonospora solifontis]NES54462.1 NAD(P)/FAD-dependent oxidoreductase [Micromonospora sp. PPF5-6]RNL93407.1 NAD(P)/FAD-dependent oxidoreductase [Micromonospora solifontis]